MNIDKENFEADGALYHWVRPNEDKLERVMKQKNWLDGEQYWTTVTYACY